MANWWPLNGKCRPWVYTVCPGLSVRKLRIITVENVNNLIVYSWYTIKDSTAFCSDTSFGFNSMGVIVLNFFPLSLCLYLIPVKRICVFEHSVMTNFNCSCPAIQRGQGSGFLSEGSSWLTACMSEQWRFWRDCANAQARLNLRCSPRR